MPTTIFWPIDVKHSGFCYGWTSPAICVAGVLQASSKEDADAILQTLRHSPRWEALIKSSGSEPTIIGKCLFSWTKGGGIFLVPNLDLWTPIDYTLIYYYRHRSNTLRFYSLDILSLDAGNRPNVVGGSVYSYSAQHDFTAPRNIQRVSSLNHSVIDQFNSALTLEDIIQHTRSAVQRHPLILASIRPIRTTGGVLLLLMAMLSHFLTRLCNIPIMWFLSSLLPKDVSAMVQQIDIRAEQGEFFVTEIRTLDHRSSTHMSLHSARYTNFFNTVWLILNDITIGFAFGSFLCENHITLSQILNGTVKAILIDWIQWVLQWLDSWPAGLKLNTELSRFYSHTFIGLISAWGEFLLRGGVYSPAFIYFIGIVSCGGVTLAISVFMDTLAILTIHIYACYVISGAVYQRVLKTAGSLWNLFRGKRYNVLRNRTDSWEYDIDQLLFGTILFTLLAFLFPTVLAYYALFAMMRFGILILQASMETLLALLNHFPLFALMLRAKDPWRLPGGVYFARVPSPGSKYPLLVIKNQPVPFSSIFFQYIQLLSRLATHYNPLRLLAYVFSGRHLAAIPRYSIRYNKIPRDHVSSVHHLNKH